MRVIACPPRAMHCPVDPVPCSRKLALYPVSERELVGRWCAVEDLVNSAANDDSEDLLGLFEGDYQLFVSYTGNDGTLCSVDTTFNIVDNPPSPTASFVVVDESCFGSCDGSITTTINSGANPITFVWSSTNAGFVNEVVFAEAGCVVPLVLPTK